jgi:hypothetical protein
VDGELMYLTGESLISSTTLNKSVHQSWVASSYLASSPSAIALHFISAEQNSSNFKPCSDSNFVEKSKVKCMQQLKRNET